MTIIYLIFVLLAAYFSFRYDGIEEDDPHKNHRYWLLCIILVCVAGFSYGLGGDKQAYMESFDIVDPELSYSESVYFFLLFQGYMPGWSALFLFVKRAFDSFYMLQFIQATIVNVAICYIVKKYTKRVFLFLLLYITWYYFLFNTEVMREGIAVSCCLFAIEAYMRKQRMIYLLLFALGLSFHISALVVLFFPLTDLVRVKISWKLLIYTTFVSFFAWLLSDILLVKIIVAVLGSAGAMAQKVIYYLSMASTVFGFVRNCMTNLVFPFIIMYFSYLWESSEEQKEKKRKIILLYIVIGVLASAIPPFSRFRNYLAPYYLAMFADMVYILFRVKEHFIIRLCTVTGTLFLISLTQFGRIKATNTHFYEYYVPYTSIFNEDRKIVRLRAIMHSETSSAEETDKNQRDVKD